MPASTLRRRGLVLGGLLAAGAAGVALLSRRSPEGPEPVAWDREACAHCRMLIGDPSFAGQVLETEGLPRNFDDAGCLFRYLDERSPSVRRIWFHHIREDRWIPSEGAGFVRSERSSPMGYDLAAVDRSEAGARDFEAARRAAPPDHGGREASR